MRARREANPTARRSRATTAAPGHTAWTEADEQRLVQILSGRRSTRRALPWAEIERAFPGRSRTAVHQRIHKLTRAGRIKRAARHWSTAECRTLMRILSLIHI